MTEDIIGDAINELKTKTITQVKELIAKNPKSSHGQLAISLGEIIAEGRREIEQLQIQDPRMYEALAELEDVFVKMTQGKDPFTDELIETVDKQSTQIVQSLDLIRELNNKNDRLEKKLEAIRIIIDL